MPKFGLATQNMAGLNIRALQETQALQYCTVEEHGTSEFLRKRGNNHRRTDRQALLLAGKRKTVRLGRNKNFSRIS